MLFSIPKLTTILLNPGHLRAFTDIASVLYRKITDAFNANKANGLSEGGRSRGILRSIRLHVASIYGKQGMKKVGSDNNNNDEKKKKLRSSQG